MLRSTHLQPGINLNPISFPSADLTLKVFKFQFKLYIDSQQIRIMVSFTFPDWKGIL